MKLLKALSPRSSSGSLFFSFLAHGSIMLGVMYAFDLGFLKASPKAETYVDMEYETFEEPPKVVEKAVVQHSPEPQTEKVPDDHTPRELQDEKSDVAGTQVAKKEVPSNTENVSPVPYYKIKPKYPPAALESETEGWVLLLVDVNEDGSVDNVRVVDGEQKNMFGGEAKRAVSQWKYRPFVDASGKPIKKADHQVRVDFKLADAS